MTKEHVLESRSYYYYYYHYHYYYLYYIDSAKKSCAHIKE